MRDAPAFHRNKQPMLAFLQSQLGADDLNVLEIASGSGQHGPYFTTHMKNLTWWPSDIDPEAIQSINFWRREQQAERVQKPQFVDVTDTPWRRGLHFPHWPAQFDVILSMNMIHIAPPEALTGLLEGASRRLVPHGKLVFYGPFKLKGKHTSQSNADFDSYLKNRNQFWGVRDLANVADQAEKTGLVFSSKTNLPANNMAVVFSKS